MRDTELLRGLLRVEDPWDVTESHLDLKLKRVDVQLDWKSPGRCPKCDRECPKISAGSDFDISVGDSGLERPAQRRGDSLQEKPPRRRSVRGLGFLGA